MNMFACSEVLLNSPSEYKLSGRTMDFFHWIKCEISLTPRGRKQASGSWYDITLPQYSRYGFISVRCFAA